ncbi:hypothetical cytosolic protein [Syntrophus aciditrophicus SB]|uniref:Hypothetical cytosolic protein n=1 Tax=Syntrophus aciditrophicus (strain SB) TaxID=56780 RepID=Q2LQN3_SYNAS|nr:hypothetical cytosolic protein [Syntrophus aciditrophicus SB]OPY17921.1 MAG: hypothetical protein A4E74_00978 [Syntrophus sp. PtaB.Bin075]
MRAIIISEPNRLKRFSKSFLPGFPFFHKPRRLMDSVFEYPIVSTFFIIEKKVKNRESQNHPERTIVMSCQLIWNPSRALEFSA